MGSIKNSWRTSSALNIKVENQIQVYNWPVCKCDTEPPKRTESVYLEWMKVYVNLLLTGHQSSIYPGPWAHERWALNPEKGVNGFEWRYSAQARNGNERERNAIKTDTKWRKGQYSANMRFTALTSTIISALYLWVAASPTSEVCDSAIITASTCSCPWQGYHQLDDHGAIQGLAR